MTDHNKTSQPATIRAIHIDPFAQTVTELAMPRDFKAMKRDVLHCTMAECVHLGGGVDAWVDEDGTLTDWEQQGWVELAGQITLAGHVVLCGVKCGDEGCDMSNLPAHVTLAQVQAMCRWPAPQDVELPGTSISTVDDDGRIVSTEYVGPAVRTYKDN